MKRIILLLILLLLASANCIGNELEELMLRDDILWGYGEDANGKAAYEQAMENLALNIGNWKLKETGAFNDYSYSRRMQLGSLTEIWLKDFIGELSEKKGRKETLLYIEKALVFAKYNELEIEIKDKIAKAQDALTYNKLGLFLRNMYESLILMDLLPGAKLEVNETLYDQELLTDEISRKTEDIVIRLKGNEYHLGMRRLLFHVLYENRPINDFRLGIVLPEESFGFSVEDRFLEIDLFGVEFAELPNLSLMMDIQDKLTGASSLRIKEMSELTGMSGFEAYRTIPLFDKKADFLYWDEQIYPVVADSLSQQELEANIAGLLENIEYGEEHNKKIFSSRGVRREVSGMLNNLKMRNLLTGGRIKVEETAAYRIWRGFKVGITFAGQIEADCNMVIKTDRSNRISGVWLGMKPIDYRLQHRNWKNDADLLTFLQIVEEMERRYTRNLIGRITGGFDEKPKYPENGWQWAEIEDVKIEELENGAYYEYKLLLSDKKRNWQGKFTGIKGGN